MNDMIRPLFNSDCSDRVRELENALLLASADEGMSPFIRRALRYRFEHCGQSDCHTCNLIFGTLNIDRSKFGTPTHAPPEVSRSTLKRRTLLISQGIPMHLPNPANT